MHSEKNARSSTDYRDGANPTMSSRTTQKLFSKLRTSNESQPPTKECVEIEPGNSKRLVRFMKSKGSFAGPEKTRAGRARRPASDEKTMAER